MSSYSLAKSLPLLFTTVRLIFADLCLPVQLTPKYRKSLLFSRKRLRCLSLQNNVFQNRNTQLSKKMATNRERQSEEIEAMLSICDTEEFYRLSDQENKVALDVMPNIDKASLDVKYTNILHKHVSSHTYCHFSVRNLPPACLHLQLPPEYPEEEPPKYDLEISWLPLWECSLICQQLDDLWEKNKGCEILFLWREFLRTEILDFLGYRSSLDVSFLFLLHHDPDNLGNDALLRLRDSRAKNGALFEHPMKHLTRFDESHSRIVLSRGIFVCEICLLQLSGEKCTEFGECGHFYCKNCTAEYLANKINSGNVARILCPEPNCHYVARNSQIKELCPNLYPKYEQILLDITLDTMNDVVFCPRMSCQFPVIFTPGETLVACTNCAYNFCFYCRKVYHGVAPCAMASGDIDKLIDAYLKGSEADRKNLIKKHGRRQIQSVVEDRLTKDYIKSKTKPCPECRTPTEKTEGCNKMICVHCRVNFCWICGLVIKSANKYDHFLASAAKNPCYGRLFEGMAEVELRMRDRI